MDYLCDLTEIETGLEKLVETGKIVHIGTGHDCGRKREG